MNAMNEDQDLERLLAQYRPVAPPPELRRRIVDAAGRRRWREWLPAAAALILAAVFYGLAAQTRHDVAAAGAALEAERQRQLVELTRALGDDDFARDAAERLLDAAEQIVRRDADQNPASVIRD